MRFGSQRLSDSHQHPCERTGDAEIVTTRTIYRDLGTVVGVVSITSRVKSPLTWLTDHLWRPHCHMIAGAVADRLSPGAMV